MLKGFVWEKVAEEQGWQFYLFCPALFVSSIHEVLGIKFKGGYYNLVPRALRVRSSRSFVGQRGGPWGRGWAY